jgi:hypothetical protein
VVKALNTTFASPLVAGQVAGLPLDVFLAGDSPAAKAQVAALARDGGMRPVDTGPLRRARELEAFQLLHMTLQGPLGLDWASAVKLLPLSTRLAPGGGLHLPRGNDPPDEGGPADQKIHGSGRGGACAPLHHGRAPSWPRCVMAR